MNTSKPLSKSRLLTGLSVPVILIWAFHAAPLKSILDTLAGLTPGAILALIGLNFVILLLFNSRWWLILQAQGRRVPYLALVKYRLAGFAISYLTPGTQFGGEPLQVYLLKARHAIPSTTAVAAVTLDKLFELLANFTFVAIGVVMVVSNRRSAAFNPLPMSILIAVLLSIPLAYLGALWAGYAPLSGLADRLPQPVRQQRLARRALPLAHSTEREIIALMRHKPGAILGSLLLGCLTWVLMVFEYWLMLKFLGRAFNLADTLTALTAARLAFLTPLPGGLGALEASQALAMGLLGANPALGISASLLMRARDISLAVCGLALGAALAKPASALPASSAGPAHRRAPDGPPGIIITTEYRRRS